MDGDVVAELVAAARQITHSPHGSVLWFVAHPDRTASKYQHAESLIWRDAGALVSVIALVAEALAVDAAPVGMTGDTLVRRLFDADGRLAGVGGVVLGSRYAGALSA